MDINSISTIIANFGFPIFFGIFYLLVIMPREAKQREAEAKRYDDLVNKMIVGQEECKNQMIAAMKENNEVIRDLTDVINTLK